MPNAEIKRLIAKTTQDTEIRKLLIIQVE